MPCLLWLIDLAPDVEIAFRTLDTEGVRRVQAWFACLQRWGTDEGVRKNSEPLEGDTVTILDIAKGAAILSSGHVSGDWTQDVVNRLRRQASA